MRAPPIPTVYATFFVSPFTCHLWPRLCFRVTPAMAEGAPAGEAPARGSRPPAPPRVPSQHRCPTPPALGLPSDSGSDSPVPAGRRRHCGSGAVAASGRGGRKRPASSRGDGAAAARITWSEEATTLFLSLLVESKEARARYQERHDNKKLRLLNQSIADKLSAVQPGVPFTVARLQNKIKNLVKAWRSLYRAVEDKRNRGGTPAEIETLKGTLMCALCGVAARAMEASARYKLPFLCRANAFSDREVTFGTPRSVFLATTVRLSCLFFCLPVLA